MSDRSAVDSLVENGAGDGRPLVAFHGSPDSSGIWSMMADEAVTTRTRLIAFDRPGFGDRPFVPGRTPLDSAGDAASIADQLGIDRFSVIGISGGAVHALATAHALGERVERITLLSGWCLPCAEGRAAMQPMLRANVALVERGSRLARPMAAASVGLAKRAPGLAVKVLIASRPKGDRAALAEPRFDALRTGIQAQFRSADAVVAELAQQLPPWPFDLADISQPTTIWQGGKDDVHPPEMGRHLASAIPNATLCFEPDLCTFDFHPLFEQILATATTPSEI